MKIPLALILLLILTACAEIPTLTSEQTSVADGPSPSESSYRTTGGLDTDQAPIEDALSVTEE